MSQLKKAVVGIVFSDDKKNILIVKRRDVPIWVLPGGGIDEGESAPEALVRELEEETGLHTKIVRQIAVYSASPPFASTTEFYECERVSGSLESSSETRAVGFYPLDKLPYPFLPVHQHWIDDALLKSGEVIHKETRGVGWRDIVKYVVCNPLLVLRYVLARAGRPFNSR